MHIPFDLGSIEALPTTTNSSALVAGSFALVTDSFTFVADSSTMIANFHSFHFPAACSIKLIGSLVDVKHKSSYQ